MTKAGWFVYLLQCADGTLYCGITTCLSRRLEEHNGLRKGGAKYTRGRRPVRMLAHVGRRDKSSALRLENDVRAVPRSRKLSFLLEQEEEDDVQGGTGLDA